MNCPKRPDFRLPLATVLLVASLSSCLSTLDRELAPQRSDLNKELAAISTALLSLDLQQSRTVDPALSRQLESLAKAELLPPEYRSRVGALQVWLLALQGDKGRVEALTKDLEKRYADSPWTQMAAALSHESRGLPDAALALWEALAGNPDLGGVSELHRARLYELSGTWGNAMASWDALLPSLTGDDAVQARRYRERCQQLADSGLRHRASLDAFQTAQATLDDWRVLASQESDLSQRYPFNWDNGAAFFEDLRQAAFLPASVTTTSSPLQRRELAMLLYAFFDDLRRDPFIRKRYQDWQNRRQRAGEKSLIPDIGLAEDWYFAAMILVEQDILRLVDGKNFNPDAPIDGQAALAATKALAERTRGLKGQR